MCKKERGITVQPTSNQRHEDFDEAENCIHLLYNNNNVVCKTLTEWRQDDMVKKDRLGQIGLHPPSSHYTIIMSFVVRLSGNRPPEFGALAPRVGGKAE